MAPGLLQWRRRFMLKFLGLYIFTYILQCSQIAEARIRLYKWDVKYEYKSPDCYKKLVITINGRSPGPTIAAQQDDTVIVEVKNSLITENLAIHWHGIRQVCMTFNLHKHVNHVFCLFCFFKNIAV